ncbi:hypothetical protein ASF98_17070 [Arthrobacter sp. Leaf337]|nr:hypothetical protein ASF98_17070 [Arthrobacter sp. Leaf337]
MERRYQVGALLGRGAEADVYQATDLLSGGSAALKIFRAEAANPDSPFNREIELHARLHHNNIMRIKRYGRMPADGGTGSGRNYIAAELAAGTDLRRAIHEGPVDAADVAAWMGGVASALSHIHRKGIVHNDVKPANIMVNRADDRASKAEAKLIDFGIATSSWHRPNTDVSGTPHYLSPEAVHGQHATSASDIYALGLVIFESLTGIKAFPGPALESMVARTLRSPRLPATVQRRWSRLLLAMTDTDPARRPSASEVHRTLHRISR